MTPDHDMLWRRCTHLGRVLLPLVDQEPWRQTRRHENLQAWGIDTASGERMIEIFTALAAHASAIDASLSAAELDDLSLKAVADTATGKRDYELLAGLPGTLPDDRDGHAVNVFRLHVYRGGRYSHQLTRLGTELRHALLVVAERAPTPLPTCGHVFRRAAEVGLPQ